MESSDLRDMNLEPSSKRRKLIQHADDDSTKFVVNPGPMPTSVKETSPSEVNVQISGTTCRSKKKSSISTSTKRASALNLHNYPSDHHPIGIAIWLLQKIDQARRSRSRSASSSSSGSESKTFAKPVPPLQPLKPAPQFQSGWNSTAAADPTQANALIDPSQAHPSLVGAGTYHPVYAHLDGGHQEEDNGRLQSQRNRKSKQRSENWAKNKENDVVARAKLEAKKKYGPDTATDPATEAEKQEYIRKRTKDDYDRLLSRHAVAFCHDMVRLSPFQPGFGNRIFEHKTSPQHDEDTILAGELLSNVLPALAEATVSAGSQVAVEALVTALEAEEPTDKSFLEAIRALAINEEVLLGVDKILRQLFGQRMMGSASSEPRLDQATPQSVPYGQDLYLQKAEPLNGPAFPSSVGNSEIKPQIDLTLISATPAPTSSPGTPDREPQKDPTLLSTSIMPSSSPIPVETAPTQPRSSGRERKPSAKILATAMHTRISRSPSVTNMLSKSAPKISSKLNKSHTVEHADMSISTRQELPTDPEGDPNLSEPNARVPLSQETKHNRDSNQIDAKQLQNMTSMCNARGNLFNIPTTPIVNDSVAVQEGVSINIQLVDNILFMAELALSMPESDDELGSDMPITGKKVACNQSDLQGRPHLPGGSTFSGLGSQVQNVAQFAPHPHLLLPNSSPISARDANISSFGQSPSLIDSTTLVSAQNAGLTYPEIPRPYTKEGWKMTGHVTDHGAEIVELDARYWTVHKASNLSSNDLLYRIISRTQNAENRIYGFPPLPGRSNKPGSKKKKLQSRDGNELDENTEFEITMHQIRRAAEERGLGFNRTLSWEQLYAMIQRFDAAMAPVPQPFFGTVGVQHSQPLTSPPPSLAQPLKTAGSPRAKSATTKQLSPMEPLPPHRLSISSASHHAPSRPPKSPAPPVMPAAYHLPLPQPPPNRQGGFHSHVPYHHLIPLGAHIQGVPPPAMGQNPQLPSSHIPAPFFTSISPHQNANPKGLVNQSASGLTDGHNIPPQREFINGHPNSVSRKLRVNSSQDIPSPLPDTSNKAGALNGGPPGGGVIINAKENMEGKMRRKQKGSDFRMSVNGRPRTPIGPTHHVRGGQIIKFELV